MSEPWCFVTFRYGQEIRNPGSEQLAAAIAELCSEDLDGMTEGDYAEHGVSSLRFGWDDGPMFVMDISRLLEVRFEEWADQDYEQELAPPRIKEAVSKEECLQLWAWLAGGEVDQIRAQPWDA